MTFERKDEDYRVVERILTGDGNAFEILVKKYQKRIYFLALRMTKSHDIADELAQESFVKAYLSLSGFQKGKSFYTWIYRIAINLILNYLKHSKFTVSLDTPAGRTYLENIPKSPVQLSRLISEEQSQIFRKALDELPHTQKAIFMLRVFDGFSYEKISEVIGCSVGTVMSRLYRARIKIKNNILNTEKKKNGKLQK